MPPRPTRSLSCYAGLTSLGILDDLDMNGGEGETVQHGNGSAVTPATTAVQLRRSRSDGSRVGAATDDNQSDDRQAKSRSVHFDGTNKGDRFSDAFFLAPYHFIKELTAITGFHIINDGNIPASLLHLFSPDT